MKYNIKVGEKWLIGESATETIKGTVRGDTTAVFSRMVGEMSAYDFADHREEAASFDRITLCDYLRGIVERQNYGHYLGEIKVIPEDREEAKAQLPKRGKWIEDATTYAGPGLSNYKCSLCGKICGTWRRGLEPSELPNWCGNCGADMRAKMEVQE